ncbi:hypothetical protein P4S72_15470 [Vibrio sp. PP-XX7]
MTRTVTGEPLCLYGQALYWLGGILCHAETKSISLTSPNACQFLLAGPKRNQKRALWASAPAIRSGFIRHLTHKTLKIHPGFLSGVLVISQAVG